MSHRFLISVLSLLFHLLFNSPQSFAFIAVDTTPRATLSAEDRDLLAQELAHAISNGDYDAAGIKWPTLKNGVHAEVALNSTLFNSLTQPQQQLVVDNLLSYHERILSRTLTVSINADREDLTTESALSRLGISAADVHGMVNAEQLLSPFTRTWAYRDSGRNGPNCWHTAIASIFMGWQIPRYMSPGEFYCHVSQSFETLNPTQFSELQFGDMLRLVDRGGNEVHGFTFLGADHARPERMIVFTKNGFARSYYVFMDLQTVREIYPNNILTYHRPRRAPQDPAEHTTECSGWYNLVEHPMLEPDPLVLAGYRRDQGLSLPVLEIP